MVEVTSFMLRWLYLSKMIRNVGDIQTLPYQPHANNYQPYQHHFQRDPEVEWRDQSLRGILSYPPGTQRLCAMDALRIELVQQLARRLRECDETMRRYTAYCDSGTEVAKTDNKGDNGDDPYMDADVEIVRAFEAATLASIGESGPEGSYAIEDSSPPSSSGEKQATLVISESGTDILEKEEDRQTELIDNEAPSESELESAYATLTTFRDYLPQIVSAVLKSPGALQPSLVDPIERLRRLMLTRCLQDANWGIELCWLLEAEVGRAWKTLFEHRQQTGKRLIVVLPAEKAAVLAKIGTEKREAFDLLQDAEQATAYGTTQSPTLSTESIDADLEPSPGRLPSSLSLRRCSHFGDTMQFIDQLTKISLDMRMIPNLERHSYLLNALNEMNRRLRRRMVTRGDVSLDVEDSRNPDDWPLVSDVSLDMLKHSVHFPLEPKRITWPGGDDSGPSGSVTERSKAGVMRVLNIVTAECRLLASRERCPFLVQLEVAETGMEGSDARLYASGTKGLGTTVEESISMPTNKNAEGAMYGPVPFYQIPSELLVRHTMKSRQRITATQTIKQAKAVNSEFGVENPQDADGSSESGTQFPSRGGYQSEGDGVYYPQEQSGYYESPYDAVRQQQYEQLHQQMQTQQPVAPQPRELVPEAAPITTRSALLDRVFGLPWSTKCEQIRQASPYGKVKGWRLASFILKAGEDIRREALVMQVISKLNEWFKTDIPESYRPKMRPYTIMCAGGDAGLLECLTDAKSVDEVKKKTDGYTSLRNYFERAYGFPGQLPSPGGISFEQAQDNFLRSLVGYSLVCYILQIKDRHNANILIDRDGHIMHIDFGFVLGDTPKMGKVPIFSERAPFKLSEDFWQVLGGWSLARGGLGVKFCKMFEWAFMCASSHADEIVAMVEAALMNLTRNPTVAQNLAKGIRNRLRMRGPPGSIEQKTFIMDLVNTARTSWGTSTYDWLQKNMNGYQ